MVKASSIQRDFQQANTRTSFKSIQISSPESQFYRRVWIRASKFWSEYFYSHRGIEQWAQVIQTAGSTWSCYAWLPFSHIKTGRWGRNFQTFTNLYQPCRQIEQRTRASTWTSVIIDLANRSNKYRAFTAVSMSTNREPSHKRTCLRCQLLVCGQLPRSDGWHTLPIRSLPPYLFR
jgi:hypothetical protein